MPIAGIRLKPGQDTEETKAYDSAAYTDVSMGRFKAGLFQKLGGWVKYYPFAMPGTPKALHAWQDLNNNQYLAAGTTTQLNVISEGEIEDITPQVLDSDIAPDFTTTNGSATVEIVDTNIANMKTTDSVFFRTPVSVGGIILSGLYPIATITGADSYTIEARENATASESNAGAVPIFDTTSGAAEVEVTLPDHAQIVGNSVVFPIPTTVGGVTIEGRYLVTAVSSVDVFIITADREATSSTTVSMNGGDAGLTYHIAVGPVGGGSGYGLGDYGEGAWGIGGTGPSRQTGDPLVVTDWTLDNWGELLIACAENGALYNWGPTTGFQNMSVITQAPFYNTGAFVSMAQQQIITYGSSINAYDDANGGIGVYQDPLLVQWCDISNFFQWTPDATNQAGNYRIPTGSKIIGGAATQNRNLIWTDLDLYGMGYLGAGLVYGFNKIGANCGLIGKHAWAQIGNSTFWMGRSNFFFYSGGGAQPIPCTVWDAVFQDLDGDNAHKCVAGSNTDFTEVWFFYPSVSGGLGYPDKYAKLNIVENTWDTGPIDRLAWIDRSILGSPIGFAANGLIYQHETGFDADTLPIMPSFTTGYFALDESETFYFVDQIIPDMKWGVYAGTDDAQVIITVDAVDTPGATPRTYGPFMVTKQSTYVDCRIRGRLLSVTVSSSDLGSFWRLGLIRFRFAPDGRR